MTALLSISDYIVSKCSGMRMYWLTLYMYTVCTWMEMMKGKKYLLLNLPPKVILNKGIGCQEDQFSIVKL